MMCESGGLELEYVRKSTAAPFLLKTYMLIEDPTTDDVVSWNGDGTSFVVWKTAEFARDLLPTLFKHSNFSSFVRQLNTYGFRKIATSRWEFSNEMFRKGERDLLCNIRRRKPWSSKQHVANDDDEEDQRSSSTSSSSGRCTLLEENKRLKKENRDLNCQLSDMKRKCKELVDLVVKYDDGPKLFGVRLDHDDEERMVKKRALQITETATLLLSQSCK